MRLRRIPGAKEKILLSSFLVENPLLYKGKWNQLFGNDRDIYLEIGMGRGRFIVENARHHKDCNWIGLEFREEMVLIAIKRLAGFVEQPQNIKFIWGNAMFLSEMFAVGEVKKIFLNFSDPWPKARHAKRRLTHLNFLNSYGQVLNSEGELQLKTDNEGLFRFSLEQFAAGNWQVHDVSENLPPDESQIMTEYEQRFRNLQQPIYYCSVGLPKEVKS